MKTQELDKLQQSKGMYITVYNVHMYTYIHSPVHIVMGNQTLLQCLHVTLCRVVTSTAS